MVEIKDLEVAEKPTKMKKEKTKKVKKANGAVLEKIKKSKKKASLEEPEKKVKKSKKVKTTTSPTPTDEPKVKKPKLDSNNNSEENNLVQDFIETPPLSDEDEQNGAEKEGDFKRFRISDKTADLLRKKNILYLFPIQINTFDHVFDGYDVVAQARTGTGKTMSFALPLVEKLQQKNIRRQLGRPPKVLVMTPTRELALQVHKDFEAITTDLKSTCIYGGTPYYTQEKAMRNGLDIVVGTPGRILDHLKKGNLDISTAEHVVLDEVDQMLDMGFAPSVEEILQYAYTEDREKPPQTLLFSATCPPWVKKTASKYMRADDTRHVDLIGKDTVRTAITVQHLAVRCHYTQRAKCIGDVVQVYSGRHGRALIFTETKKDANELGLNDSVKVETQVLHGDIEQKQREITLKAFREGAVKCLVATNVAARGLDIPEVDLVIQINPPKDIESYIHRSGRTGRAGRLGTCICFYKPNEEELLRRVERIAGIKFKRIAPPQPKDIIQSSYDDAIRSLDSVPEKICSKFLTQAEKVAEKYAGGALEALAAALAHMSGATDLASRSLLNAKEGFATWQMTSAFEVRFAGFFYNAIEKSLGPDVREKVQGLRLTQDKKGAVFDIPTNLTSFIQESWHDSDKMKLCEAETIPELLERDNRYGDRRSSGGFGGNRWGSGGARNGRGGFRGGRGGGSRGGGFKRKWNS